MGGGISLHHHVDDSLFMPTFMLSFAVQWPWFPSSGWCLACCPCSLNSVAAGQRQLTWAAVINWP